MFYKSNQFKVNIIWTLFFICLFTIGIHLANRLLNLGLNPEITENLMLFFPAVLLVLHSTFTLGVNKAFGFICLAALVGLIMEILGLQTGVIFGGNYVYKQSSFMLFNVPLIVPIYWAIFIYTTYCVSNAFLFWLNKNKPNFKNRNFYLILPLVFFNGLFTVLIDLIMDPIQVHAGTWTWLDKGVFYNVPFGNFFGWFLVTAIVVSIFRIYEYFFPAKTLIDNSTMLIPVIGYGIIGLAFTIMAVSIGYHGLAIVSMLTLLPVCLINLGLFLYQKTHPQ